MIRRKFTGRITKSDGMAVDVPVGVEAIWDPDHDPLAVMLIFSPPDQDDAVWRFGRQLMVEAFQKRYPVGQGDIRFYRLVEGFGVCLQSKDGHADVILPLRDVEAFIGETLEHTPLGEEKIDDLVDAFVKELMEG